jgi:hypothetical protein
VIGSPDVIRCKLKQVSAGPGKVTVPRQLAELAGHLSIVFAADAIATDAPVLGQCSGPVGIMF